MTDKTYNVLFLCTGNTARSIMAEVLLNNLGRGSFKGYSAGSHPKGEVHPLTIDLLEKNRLSTAGLRSKDWAEFAQPDAPKLDFVITVCDNAAGEVCPIWPGQPMTAHWGVPDPAAAASSDDGKQKAFLVAYTQLSRRILLFVSLPLNRLSQMSLQEKLDEIGKTK